MLRVLKTLSFNLSDRSDWFNVGARIRKDLPPRTGYLLGYRVVKELAKKYSIDEMSGFDMDRLHKEVKSILKLIAKN